MFLDWISYCNLKTSQIYILQSKPNGLTTHHRAKLGTGVKKVEKLKRVDCIEAERILFIVEQFLSHLLLIGGLQASLVSEVKDFPSEIVILKKSIISPQPDRSNICDLTRNSLRVLASHPDLCSKLRSHTFDPRFKKVSGIVLLL